ncbi:unnamed protein product [Tenebrio molitor]|nr:unnamed protein product [Tenebrio molitor]
MKIPNYKNVNNCVDDPHLFFDTQRKRQIRFESFFFDTKTFNLSVVIGLLTTPLSIAFDSLNEESIRYSLFRFFTNLTEIDFFWKFLPQTFCGGEHVTTVISSA